MTEHRSTETVGYGFAFFRSHSEHMDDLSHRDWFDFDSWSHPDWWGQQRKGAWTKCACGDYNVHSTYHWHDGTICHTAERCA